MLLRGWCFSFRGNLLDQRPATFAIHHYGMIARDEDVQVAESAEKFKQLAQNWNPHFVILAQVYHRVFVINWGEDQENKEIIRKPVLPQHGQITTCCLVSITIGLISGNSVT